MSTVYLLAAIIGAVAPYVFFVRYFLEPGGASFVEQLFMTAPAAGFTTDLLVTSAVFWIWAALRKATPQTRLASSCNATAFGVR